jgi:hypothetical protein
MGPHKAPRNVDSTSRLLKLTPGIARFEARYINDGFARIFPVRESSAIAVGARAPRIRHRDREFELLEPGISIAYRARCSGFERRLHRGHPWDCGDSSKGSLQHDDGNINK